MHRWSWSWGWLPAAPDCMHTSPPIASGLRRRPTSISASPRSGREATRGRSPDAGCGGQAADSSLVTDRARTVESVVGEFVAPVRVMLTLLGAFGVTGMLLAGLGIFGTMSYTSRKASTGHSCGAGRWPGGSRAVRPASRAGDHVHRVGRRHGDRARGDTDPRELPVRHRAVRPADLRVTAAGGSRSDRAGACVVPLRRAASTDPLVLLR